MATSFAMATNFTMPSHLFTLHASESTLPNPSLAGSLLVITVLAVLYRISRADALPINVPLVGTLTGKRFFRIRSYLASFSNFVPWLDEGYFKYAKQDKAYFVPDNGLGRSEMIIPQSQLKWLLDYPDEEVSIDDVHTETLQLRHAFGIPDPLKRNYHRHILLKVLPRKLPLKIPDLWDELVDSFEVIWGLDTENWTNIGVHDDALKMIARISNRLFIGNPLCRNTVYLRNSAAYAQDVFKGFMLLRLIPWWLKSFLAPFITIPTKYHSRKNMSFTLPVIKERLANIQKKIKEPDWDWEAPSDYVTWHIQAAMAENVKEELDPANISYAVVLLNFAAIHTTSFALTNLLLDIASSKNKDEIIETLREEVQRVLKEENGQWTKRTVNKLIRVDSAIRESMRLNTMLARATTRAVKTPHGIFNKHEGWTAPKGTWISVSAHSIHHDPDVYSDPWTYDAFRFSRPQEKQSANPTEAATLDEKVKLKTLGIVSTSSSFVAFGHGRHACPGRFFLAIELKMLVAHMVMNYEIEALPTRRYIKWFGQNSVPPLGQSIRVRRRKDAVPL